MNHEQADVGQVPVNGVTQDEAIHPAICCPSAECRRAVCGMHWEYLCCYYHWSNPSNLQILTPSTGLLAMQGILMRSALRSSAWLEREKNCHNVCLTALLGTWMCSPGVINHLQTTGLTTCYTSICKHIFVLF